MKKGISLLLVLVMVLALCAVPAGAAQEEIKVILNGKPLTFDVQPTLINDRTMVPMRAIFEALGARVAWNDQNEAVTGISRAGKRVVIAIGSNTAMVNGKASEIDQPPVLINDRTLVPLRFISESFDCKVDWDDATQTVTITEDTGNSSTNGQIMYLGVGSFDVLGCWTMESTTVLKGKTNPEGQKTDVTDDDAIASFDILKDGKYKVWVNSKDYAKNQPGSRYFNVAVDGKRADLRLGAHGSEGFKWQEIGTYDFTEGQHTVALQDTSGFYARCQGIIISGDMNYVPSDNYDEYSAYMRDTKFEGLVPANYPAWAKKPLANETTETIQNDKIKVVFYQGTGERGTQVQNEIYLMNNGSWQLVKAKSEDLGVLAMRANETVVSTARPGISSLADLPKETVEQKFDGAFGEIHGLGIMEYYKTGRPEWLIPTVMTKKDDKTVVLGASSDNVDATLTFTLDDLTYEPKVTMDATMKTAGAYSFAFFTGDDFKDGSFSRVTAPLTYVKDFVPEKDIVLSEYMMFTPMCTFTFGTGKDAITKGVVVDPQYVRQDVATPGLSDFGVMFRSPTGNVRGNIIAPLFGTQKSIFEQGGTYSFGYRLVYNNSDWFDNYKHVTQDMYNLKDLRTNYYTSINEAIYNCTDLLMDDMYGGWDEKDMAFYNMEAKQVTTISNGVELMQRYMLTDNEDILEKRAIPALAFMLSRGGMHFKRVEGNNSYTTNTPTPLSGVNTGFAPSSYIGLYEMSQGRTPFLFNYALGKLNSSNLNGVAGGQAMTDLMGADDYKESIKKAADNYITSMLESKAFKTQPFVGGFIYSDSVPMLNTFVKAYEETGEQKYLDAAKTVAEYIMTEVWTTGYQNDYATTDYTVDPVKTAERPLANDTAAWYYHKDGVQWRIGNPFGVNTKASESENKLKEETAPGWVPARAGMGTEHLMTPSNGNAITMNMWAGTMLRLAKYTGEDYFKTMARNAMVGRFGNYGGYYWERYLLHDKQADYPYKGPDYDLIYWHHIPVFLGLLEDFLINDIWDMSDANIEFPSVINAGYAYFVTNQYGFKPGKFYDENDMWLWLDRGIVEPDSVEVDYLTAKKDGVLGVALVNEGNSELTTTVKLGDKIPNAETYNETATLYDRAGNKSTVEIVNGSFTVTIPSKGIQSVVLHPDVKIPSYAKADFTVSADLGKTVVNQTAGKAYLLQFNDNSYYAYVYTTKKADEITSATINYTIGGKDYSETINEYPFEKIIKVDAGNDFTYTMTVKKTDGSTESLGGGTLSPLKPGEYKPYTGGGVEALMPTSNLPKFEKFTAKILGMGSADGIIRCVVEGKNFPFEKVTVDYMTGAKVKALLTNRETGANVILESVVEGNEVRDNGTYVLKIRETAEVPAANLSSDTYKTTDIWILPPDADFKSVDVGKATEGGTKTDTTKPTAEAKPQMSDFDPITVKPLAVGNLEKIRVVVPLSAFPFEVTANNLTGLKVVMDFKEKASGKTIHLDSVVVSNEMRDTSTVLNIEPTEEAPIKIDYAHETTWTTVTIKK